MERLLQRRTREGHLFPTPFDGEQIEETPPCLAWLLEEGCTRYRVVLRDTEQHELWSGETEQNYIVPDRLLQPGSYSWNLYSGERERGWWQFEILPTAVRVPRVSAEQVFQAVPAVHPRHLFFAADIPQLCRTKNRELETLKRNIAAAIADGLPERPRYHTDAAALPMREYINVQRQFIDRNLVACALGHALLQDPAATAHAKKLLLTVCDWNPAGPCSVNGPWGDEVGLSFARCLPAVYDLLWDVLTEQERVYVEQTVATYAQQCEERLRRLNYCQNPGSSHAGRIPAYMGEAALVLKGSCVEEATLRRWLAYALDIYGGIFPFYGGADGSWAEGVFYASSYTKWYLPFFMAVERYAGFRLLDRPFYQRLTQYFLHFASPDFENHPFCDGYWCSPEDAEWPGFFAQNPCRLYAQRFGPVLALQRAKKAAAPELFELHLLDVFIPDGEPPRQHLTGEAQNMAVFPYGGFVSLHTDLADTKRDVALLIRASRFGSVSHEHADQGSFALFSKGKALISPSGYFGRKYGTKHHREWTNTSFAHNVITVNGNSMKTWSYEATGKIVSCKDEGDRYRVLLDLSAAYPELTVWTREFVFEKRGALTVRDHVEAPEPVWLEWRLHTLSRPALCGAEVQVSRAGELLTVLPQGGLLPECRIEDRFPVDLNEGEPRAYWVEMPQQFHLTWRTETAAVHDIQVVLKVNGGKN